MFLHWSIIIIINEIVTTIIFTETSLFSNMFTHNFGPISCCITRFLHDYKIPCWVQCSHSSYPLEIWNIFALTVTSYGSMPNKLEAHMCIYHASITSPSLWKKHTEVRLSCLTDFCFPPPQNLPAGLHQVNSHKAHAF